MACGLLIDIYLGRLLKGSFTLARLVSENASDIASLYHIPKGAFTLANFARDFALSLHVLLNKNYLFYLLNMQASAKSRVKSRQCKRTLRFIHTRDVDLVRDAISIETLPSFQIAMAGDSDNL